MRVRSRLSERQKSLLYTNFGKSAMTNQSTSFLPFMGRRLLLLVSSDAFWPERGGSCPFRHDLGWGIMIRAIVLPTRQMGWPTLGCNQQDLWGASERLVNCKPACMVPKVAGGRAANTAHQNQTFFNSDCRWRRIRAAQPKNCAASVCRQRTRANCSKENVPKWTSYL